MKPHWEIIQKTKIKEYISLVELLVNKIKSFQFEASNLDPIQKSLVHAMSETSEFTQYLGFRNPELENVAKALDEVGKIHPLLSNAASPTSSFRTCLCYLLFKRTGERIYRIGNDFAEILQGLKLTVKPDYLVDEPGVICIEIPDSLGLCLKEGQKIKCVYLSVMSDLGNDSRGFVVKRIEASFHYDEDGYEDKFFRTLIHFYAHDETLDDAFGKMSEWANQRINVDTLKFIVNCYLYIHSGNPDLRMLRPPKRPLTKKPKEQRRFDKMASEIPMVPVTLVGFDWKKEKIYSVDGTLVKPHVQGYWCGSGFEKRLELRFKDEYEKKFKNVIGVSDGKN